MTIPSGDIVTPGQVASRLPALQTCPSRDESSERPPSPRARPNHIAISLANGKTIHVPMPMPQRSSPALSPDITPKPSIDAEVRLRPTLSRPAGGLSGPGPAPDIATAAAGMPCHAIRLWLALLQLSHPVKLSIPAHLATAAALAQR